MSPGLGWGFPVSKSRHQSQILSQRLGLSPPTLLPGTAYGGLGPRGGAQHDLALLDRKITLDDREPSNDAVSLGCPKKLRTVSS